MKLTAIESGTLSLDGGSMFGIVPKMFWEKKYPADENNMTTWALRSLLVETNGRKILIDTGMGDKQSDTFFERYGVDKNQTTAQNLKKQGINTNEITDVIHTHLHFDHCGGSVKYDPAGELVPTFPNASYWVSRQHWNLVQNPNHLEAPSFLDENILPLQKHQKLRFIENQGEFCPGIYLKIYNGHTAGQLIPYIKYGSKTLVFMGDLIASAAHVPLSFVMAYDTQPLISIQEKKDFFQQALKNNYVMFFEHDFYNQCATLKQTPRGARIDKTFCLNQWQTG